MTRWCDRACTCHRPAFSSLLRSLLDVRTSHRFLLRHRRHPDLHFNLRQRPAGCHPASTATVTTSATTVAPRQVLNDPAVFHAVTSDVNRPVGVAQAYTRLKGVVDNLRSALLPPPPPPLPTLTDPSSAGLASPVVRVQRRSMASA